MRTLEKLGVTNAFDDDAGFRGTSGIPQIIRYFMPITEFLSSPVGILC